MPKSLAVFVVLVCIASAFGPASSQAPGSRRTDREEATHVSAQASLSQVTPAGATVSLAAWARGLGGMLAPKIVTNVAEEMDVFCRPPLALLGLCYALLGAYAEESVWPSPWV